MAAHTVHLCHELPRAPQVAKTLISVRDRNGAYQTNTVHGQRASSTSDYRTAATALAHKLHPRQAWELRQLDCSQHGLRVFELELVR